MQLKLGYHQYPIQHQGNKNRFARIRSNTMSHKENWLEKLFDFNFPTSKYIEFLRFLRETPAKIEMLVKELPKEILTRRDGDSWSIQENIGHFLTAESLFIGRLDDYENDASFLRPARFENNPTDKANFNEKEIQWILYQFREQRAIYIGRLDALRPEDFEKAILHPRLNKPMRLCDMLFFQAQHDEHHLTRIAELKDLWQIS
jgi:uncharacterized damage-inducible protein DinB